MQHPELQSARRRFLELYELLETSEVHGRPETKQALLRGRASVLTVPAADKRSAPARISALDETASPLPASDASFHTDSAFSPSASAGHSAIFSHIEAKNSEVAQIPGIELLTEYSTKQEVVSEQCQLLVAHAGYIEELIDEYRLVTQISRHAAAHPVYEAAHGLESYFGGLIISLSLKLEIVAADMHTTLYTPEVARAIEELWEIMQTHEQRLRKEQSALDERLAIYRSAGSEFEDIAAAYSAILAEADQVRLDIERISRI
ncbi:hypothetical protein LPJ53_003819 [Coemansia erecta]|uniref:HAUS augmin-like complex subunit 4 n=1 Tax=Coemansia erecta TaxID=147472 RepID=A0A9W8CSC6_9FUNG|nr:hypothetical protein LPJ53_003819 [Coemansia erecta]